MSGNEDWICKRAYELWDSAGRPDGRNEEFWFAAKAEAEGTERKAEPRLSCPRRAETRRHETAADWGMRQPPSRQ